jgi:hypothetical protein
LTAALNIDIRKKPPKFSHCSLHRRCGWPFLYLANIFDSLKFVNFFHPDPECKPKVNNNNNNSYWPTQQESNQVVVKHTKNIVGENIK